MVLVILSGSDRYHLLIYDVNILGIWVNGFWELLTALL